ncbi:hypothetical protein STSO111631_20550 [Stackebrandtia soli]
MDERHDRSGDVAQRFPGQAAGLGSAIEVGRRDAVAAERRVAGDDSGDAVRQADLDGLSDRRLGEVGRQFDEDRFDPTAARLVLVLLVQRRQELRQVLRVLEVA